MSSTLDHVDGYIRYPAPPRQTRLIPKDVVLGRIRERGNLSLLRCVNAKTLDGMWTARVLINRALLAFFVESHLTGIGRRNNEVPTSGTMYSRSRPNNAREFFQVLARLPRPRDRAFSRILVPSSVSIRFVFFFYPGERQGGLSSRLYCAGVNYVRINAES